MKRLHGPIVGLAPRVCHLDPTALAQRVTPSPAVGNHTNSTQALRDFRTDTNELFDDEFADLLGDTQRTSSRGEILKALAVPHSAHQESFLSVVRSILEACAVIVVGRPLFRVTGARTVPGRRRSERHDERGDWRACPHRASRT